VQLFYFKKSQKFNNNLNSRKNTYVENIIDWILSNFFHCKIFYMFGQLPILKASLVQQYEKLLVYRLGLHMFNDVIFLNFKCTFCGNFYQIVCKKENSKQKFEYSSVIFHKL